MSPILEQLAVTELFSELRSKQLRKLASFGTSINIKPGRNLEEGVVR
jgi:hypothetical protein